MNRKIRRDFQETKIEGGKTIQLILRGKIIQQTRGQEKEVTLLR